MRRVHHTFPNTVPHSLSGLSHFLLGSIQSSSTIVSKSAADGIRQLHHYEVFAKRSCVHTIQQSQRQRRASAGIAGRHRSCITSSAPAQRRTFRLSCIAQSNDGNDTKAPSQAVDRIVKMVENGEAKNIVAMVGAGVSVSSGIPDFRSPGTGLYDNLQKYALPYPEAIFDLDYFRDHPQAFNLLAKELYPGNFEPTAAHYLLRVLHERGLLRRCYTQNIDSLEAQAGLPAEAVVAAHGNFDAAACIACRAPADPARVREMLLGDQHPKCEQCGGLVKPSIVFFGERLPERFFQLAQTDMPACDLLLVMGTSLQVHPFAGLVGQVPGSAVRVLVNREVVGEGPGGGFQFGPAGAARDLCFLGDCDDFAHQLLHGLGWRDHFDLVSTN